MSIKFNDTQLVVLSAASQRDDHCLVPPTGPKRGQAQKAIVKLLEAGFVKEIRAKAGAPIWRRDEEKGHTYALRLTAAGVKAIAVDETPSSQGEAEWCPDHLMVSVDPKAELRTRANERSLHPISCWKWLTPEIRWTRCRRRPYHKVVKCLDATSAKLNAPARKGGRAPWPF